MKCPKCGAINKNDAVFCSLCLAGFKMSKPTTSDLIKAQMNDARKFQIKPKGKNQ